MKKLIAIVMVLLSLCFVLTACYGKNYPGAAKSKYWVSEDETIMFYFPAEAELFVYRNNPKWKIISWRTGEHDERP